jgi:hypothetical protein
MRLCIESMHGQQAAQSCTGIMPPPSDRLSDYSSGFDLHQEVRQRERFYPNEGI